MGIIPGGPMPGITGYIIPGGGAPMAIPIISLGRFESGSPMLARPGRRERETHQTQKMANKELWTTQP